MSVAEIKNEIARLELVIITVQKKIHELTDSIPLQARLEFIQRYNCDPKEEIYKYTTFLFERNDDGSFKRLVTAGEFGHRFEISS